MSSTAPARLTMPLQGGARDAWERALDLWKVRMHDAQLSPGAGVKHGAPAWFSFPPSITVDPAMVAGFGAADELESVFAHEIGHHVLAPSTRIDMLKIRHQIARTLVSAGAVTITESSLGLLNNLWTDLLVNARVALLQRQRDRDSEGEPGIIRFYRLAFADNHDTQSRLWWVYLRTYEHLWNLPAGSLCAPEPPPARESTSPTNTKATGDRTRTNPSREEHPDLLEAQRATAAAAEELARATTTNPALDADLLAGVVRTFATDPVGGALHFGVIMAPYLIEAGAGGAAGCAADQAPASPGELGRILSDPRLSSPMPSRGPQGMVDNDEGTRGGISGGQAFGLSQTLELYASSDADAVIAAWYRSQAARWVRPYTQRRAAFPAPDLPGPIDLWDTGDDLADLDWSATVQAGPDIIPGVTTRQRSALPDEPTLIESSIELDLYVDSSGSMPQPQRGSPAVLAGTILALSVLRGGGRVRVTSFSGPGDVAGAQRFSRDPATIMRDLTSYFGRSTSFPLDLLDRRYGPLRPPDTVARRHLVVLSDDGLVSMFGHGNEPYAHVAAATRTKLTTGTLILLERARGIEPTAKAAGYDCEFITMMDDAPAVCARLAEVWHG